MWKRQPAVRPPRLADQPSESGRPAPQKGGSNEPQKTGRAGEPVVTLLKSHLRSTKPTRAGSARAPTEKSQDSCLTHLQSDTSLHFHIATLSAHGKCSNGVWYRERVHVHLTNSRSIRLKLGMSHILFQSSSVPAPLNEFSRRIRWCALG